MVTILNVAAFLGSAIRQQLHLIDKRMDSAQTYAHHFMPFTMAKLASQNGLRRSA